MTGLTHAQSFRDLIVYQKSRQLSREIMMEKSEMFCGELPRTVREESAEYFIETDN